MHPAKSVIFFTTASGAGYGLLIWLAVANALGLLPASWGFALAAFAASLGLITAGLLSSTMHLGHPERAWRAMSQWRSSWLSREGLAALATYGPAGLFAFFWIVFGARDGLLALLGLLAAAGALATVYCTAMIYASLKTIRAWHTPWTFICYAAFSLMTGGLLLCFLARLWDLADANVFASASLLLIGAAFLSKAFYWKHLDGGHSQSTAETATGLGDFGKVSMLEPPHTEKNYLLKEMGFQIARKHAQKLRSITWVTLFAVPLVATGLSLAVAGAPATLLALVGVLSAALGIIVERWLFFAEAQHVVTLYYGASSA